MFKKSPCAKRRRALRIERLEPRLVMTGVMYGPDPVLTATQVSTLLARASAADNTQSAVIAVVDRGGDILGVRVEGKVPTFSSTAEEVFAIDGAVAEARTGALFSSDVPNGSPLSSRAIQFISQTTITQREVDSSPEATNPTLEGPGFVAPIGIGGLFPPGIQDTAVPDLFEIEGTNRDIISSPGRFNAPNNVPANMGFNAMFSYGDAQVSNLMPGAVPRGIGTLPGGVPIYEKVGNTYYCVGGIGVFFPGPSGYASYEQANAPSNPFQTQVTRENSPLCLRAEAIAFAAAGGSAEAAAYVGQPLYTANQPINNAPALNVSGGPVFDIPFSPSGISLSGITVNDFGQNGNYQGPISVYQQFLSSKAGGSVNGALMPVTPGGMTAVAGQRQPYGWLIGPRVSPDGSSSLTVAQVTQIINQGVTEANLDRSQIRLPLGSTPDMVIAVSDKDGNILGLYRMPDATIFSEDVAVAKARNTAYYDSTNLQTADKVAGISVGTAFTNRTFRFLAEPRYPEGVGNTPGPWSALTDPGINPATGEDIGAPLSISVYTSSTASELAHSAFVPTANFRDPIDPLNQNGVVFFPGSSAIYVGGVLQGGLGASGDGVDEDDVVTFSAAVGYTPPAAKQVSNFFFRNVRLPYQEFPLNPRNK